MIRKRDWAYSVLAFGCPKDKLEDLKTEIIKKHGKTFELIADEKPKQKNTAVFFNARGSAVHPETVNKADKLYLLGRVYF